MSAMRSRPPVGEPGAANVSRAGDTTSVTPAADVLLVIPTDTTRLVRVRCPYCGRIHTHGWPYGETGQPGHRVAHCKAGRSRGYEIVAPQVGRADR